MFESLGRFVLRRRWAIIAAWLVAVAVSLAFAPRVGSVLRAGGFSTGELEAELAFDRLQEGIGTPGASLLVVFNSDSLSAADPEFVASAARALHPLTQLEFVVHVRPFWEYPRQIGETGRTAYAAVFVDIDEERSHRIVETVVEALGPTDLNVYVGGGPAFYNDIQSVSESDLQRAEIIGLPFAAIVLLIVFGSVVAAAMPVAAGGATVLIGLSALWALGQFTSFSIFALNVVTLIGLGLGADYSLFLVSRFREELAVADVETALVRTVASAGRAVFFSGLAVLVGLSSLLIFEFMMLRSIGIGGAVVVFIAVLAAITLVPACLAVLGSRIDSLRIWRPRLGPGYNWQRVARAVMRRPLPIFVVVSAVLIAMGIPFLHARISAPDASVLPSDSPSRQAYDLLRSEFGEGSVSPLFIAIEFPRPALHSRSIAEMHTLAQSLEHDERVARIDSIVSIDPRITLEEYQLLYADPEGIADPYAAAYASAFVNGGVAIMSVEPRSASSSEEARELVYAIREYRDAAGLDALVGGGAAGLTDFVDRLYTDFPRAVVIILVATYIVLAILFRSAVLPLKAVVMNVMSLLASFGVLVLVFQDGWLSGLLGFEPLGFIEATLPIVLFALLFGLSMDYEVFLLSRIMEARDAGANDVDAVALGLARSGRVITSAALVVIVVSLAFVSADIVLVKAIGLGAAMAVFVDATIIRSLLVPSTMRLLGRWNWWAPALPGNLRFWRAP